MRTFVYELRHVVRGLIRRPGFSLVLTLTLALGIGTTTGVFTVVHGVLLRPLPFADAHRLYHLYEEQTATGFRSWVSAPSFQDWREELEGFQEMAALTTTGFNVAGGEGRPERTRGLEVTPGFFRVLGADMALGRGFLEGEGGSPPARVAVISHGIWQRQFAASPDVVGQSLELDGVAHRIVGVLQEGEGYLRGQEVWVPVDLSSAEWKRSRGTRWLLVLGRLAPGVSPEQARDEMQALGAALAEAHPNTNGETSIAAEPIMEVMVGDVRLPLLVLLGAVGLVLLVVCVNVSGMLLARSLRRRRETAIRRSLGGGTGRLLGRSLLESVVVSAVGGGLGVLLALGEVQVLRSLAPPGTPRIEEAALDGGVLLFAMGLSLLAGVAAGLLPALRETRVDPREGLVDGPSSSGGRMGRSRGGLAVAQVALAVVLAVGAGHLLQTFRNLREVDPGFRPRGVLSTYLPLTEGRYGSEVEIATFYGRLLDRVRGLPGVQGAAVSSVHPLGGNVMNFSFDLRDPAGIDARELVAGYGSVSPGYFETLGVELLAGRTFREGDGAGGAPVVIVDETFARRFFPGEDALGQEILSIGDRWRRVVGVVASVRRRGLRDQADPMFYVSMEQDPRDAMNLMVRTGADRPTSLVPAVREIVADLDPTQPLVAPRPMQEYVDRTLARPRFLATVVTFFGAVTLFLAALGIYGVVSQAVAGRLREIGIRMALGARGSAVRARVVRQSLVMAGIGLVVGALAAVPAVEALRSLLFGVSTLEWSVVAGVMAVLTGAALAAAYPPARRATRVDPVTVLRAE